MSLLAPNFATYTNLSNVLQNFCYIGILAIGMTPILISGGIDISVGAVLGLCGVVLGLLLEANWPLWAGILATLLLGTGLGAINGIFIAYLRLQPFLVTLGMLSIARSMALIVSSGEVVYSFGQAEQAILAIGGGRTFGVPNVLYAMIVSAIVLHFLMTMTRWGRYVFAIGGNQRAARLTGLPVKRIKISVYMFGGLMAGITSIFLVGWLGSVTNALGQGDELRVIAGTVIGGASSRWRIRYRIWRNDRVATDRGDPQRASFGRRQPFLAGQLCRRVHHPRDHPAEISGSRRRRGVETKAGS